MPIYDYLCADCGSFQDERPMAEYDSPQPCPGCGGSAPRALLSAPSFALMDGGKRRAHATNEKSAHAPRVARGHGASCGCCKPAKRKAEAVSAPAAKSFPGRRPWMLSH
jgi:putative FmdB family regulatory protein